MKKIILLLVIAAVAVAIFYFYPRWNGEPEDPTRLRVSGNIEAHESVLSFKVSGRISELAVTEGQWVDEGALIARLDDSDYRQQAVLDESGVRLRESDLALALAGTRQREIEAAEQTLLEAEAELGQRRLDVDRAERLFARDVISAEDRDRAATALKRATAVRDRAHERLELAREGAREEEIAISRASVRQAREALALSRIRLGHTELRAPRAGVVLVRQAELGEVVAPGTPVVTLGDLENVWLRAYIPQTELGRVRWGQEAELTIDTFPDKTYPGKISFIASQAEFTPRSIETHRERVTLVYRIKIDVPNPDHELKPGMPADAVIRLEPQPPES
jgi:HlyD family secretion protein